jgi:homoserine dehydrogenase
MKKINIGILGCGNIGSKVAELLQKNSYEKQLNGDKICLKNIAVKNLTKKRENIITEDIITDNPFIIVNDPNIDIIIELIGGIEPAKELIMTALTNKKSVITANKELLASSHGSDIINLANEMNVDLFYSASVCGAVPILECIKKISLGDNITKILGIVNGTTNYILTQMYEKNVSFEDALKEAQLLGFAESNPSKDIDGVDSSSKCVLITNIAFNTSSITIHDVLCQGISNITKEDIIISKKINHTIKLIAITEKLENNEISIRVNPMLIPNNHPFVNVNNEYNAVIIQSENTDDLFFQGKGAGPLPTSSSIICDLISILQNKNNKSNKNNIITDKNLIIKQKHEIISKYLIRIIIKDKTQNLHNIIKCFENNKLNIKQIDTSINDKFEVIIITDFNYEYCLTSTINSLLHCDNVDKIVSVFRFLY